MALCGKNTGPDLVYMLIGSHSSAARPRITVPQPCGEDFSAMPRVPGGKYCGQCSKVITDFTKMTDAQLIDWMRTHRNSCGTFRPDQLNRDLIEPVVRKVPFGLSWLLSLLVMSGCIRDDAGSSKKTRPATEQTDYQGSSTLGEPALAADTTVNDAVAPNPPLHKRAAAAQNERPEAPLEGEMPEMYVTAGVPVMEYEPKVTAADTSQRQPVRALTDSIRSDHPRMTHDGTRPVREARKRSFFQRLFNRP